MSGLFGSAGELPGFLADVGDGRGGLSFDRVDRVLRPGDVFLQVLQFLVQIAAIAFLLQVSQVGLQAMHFLIEPGELLDQSGQTGFLVSQFQFLGLDLLLYVRLLAAADQETEQAMVGRFILVFPVQVDALAEVVDLCLDLGGLQFQPPVMAQVLLELVNVDRAVRLADIVGDKAGDVLDRGERNSSAEQGEVVPFQTAKVGGQLVLVLLVGGRQLVARPLGQVADPGPEAADVHRGLVLADKMVIRDPVAEDKPLVGPLADIEAVEHAADGKHALGFAVLELAGDNAAETALAQAAAGPVAVVAVLAGQVTFQCPLGLFVGGLVEEAAGVGVAEQDNLQRVDDGRLADAGLAGQEVDLVQFDQLVRIEVPVDEQDAFQVLGHRSPFSSLSVCQVSSPKSASASRSASSG